ncbi:MAG: tRNA glutamyl-Q(34) synthetase GluQRS [Gallionella sp.]|nr:tRNA glutamyl-Q(34) synthetase GluQRS [Gallionella sp.]
MPSSTNYRGRFAPSPTGSLHFGSLVAAVGSYLDAKHHHGTWLVRVEDLDTPRCMAGAADDILRTLAAFGLHSDEPALYQSQRTAAYEAALQQLQTIGAVYPCCCTRKEVADSALHGIDGQIYPGTCRNGITEGREERSWRVRTNLKTSVRAEPVEAFFEKTEENYSSFDKLRTNEVIQFNDTLQGHITQHLENEIGDFVVKRADGLFAYQLAVVVDDAFQGITHIVRGADLLHSSPRQIYLQQLLDLPTPHYMHLPIAVNTQGEKLSKQTLAQAISTDCVAATLISVLEFLQQQPPVELRAGSIEEILDWAVENWRLEQLKNVPRIAAWFCRSVPCTR